MNRKDLEVKDQDDLIAIAKNQFNLDVDRRYSKDKLIELILSKAASSKDAGKFTGFPDENGEFVVPPGGAVVEIQPGDTNPYKRPVPLGVNGKFIYAPVERPICIAGKYLEVLRNAQRIEVTQKRDESGNMQTFYNTKTSYPFAVHYHNKTDKPQKVQV